MKSFITALALIILSSCGSDTPSQKPFSPTLSDASKNLLTHQHHNFDNILTELRREKRKTSHWIWWVFPTEHPGNSEPQPRSSIALDQVDDVLAHADLKKWTLILTTIASLLERNALPGAQSKPNKSIIPSIDHGRIAHSLNFWLRKAAHKTRKHQDFYRALHRLDKFKWR